MEFYTGVNDKYTDNSIFSAHFDSYNFADTI